MLHIENTVSRHRRADPLSAFCIGCHFTVSVLQWNCIQVCNNTDLLCHTRHASDPVCNIGLQVKIACNLFPYIMVIVASSGILMGPVCKPDR